MISAAAWVAKGRAARHPTKYSVDDSELDRVAQLANVHFEDAKTQYERAQRAAAGWTDDADKDSWQDEIEGESEEEDDGKEKDEEMATDEKLIDEAKKQDPDDLSRYNLDAYDEEAEDASNLGAFSNIKGLQYYRNNDEDPYITLKEDPRDEEEEKKDLEVQEKDNLIICAKTEDDLSLLEAYLYTSKDANLYVHHDLMLPSFPLCLEWLDYKPAGASGGADQNSNVGQVGSYVAVGTMDPEIEIWSMDIVEGLFPDALLGRRDLTAPLNAPKGTGKKKRRETKERTPNASYHVDAVLGLSWNRVARNLLGSASADTTIKLWDLSRPAETSSTSGGTGALRSFDDLHTDKVQCLEWDTSNSSRGAVSQAARLLSGAYDKTLCVFDSRSPASAVRARVTSDVEAVRWNPWREHNFLVATEDGIVQAFDARMMSANGQGVQPVFTLAAHDGACTTLDISPHIPGCIVTAGTDKLVKLWNVEGEAKANESETMQNDAAWRPSSISMVANRNLDAGKIFTAQFSPDDPLTIVAGGSKGSLRVWDALANVGARKTFGERLRSMPPSLAKTDVRIDGDEPARGDGVIGLEDESDGEDDQDVGAGEEMMEE